MINIQKFTRKPFDVEAVKVTEENITDVAAWCHGTIRKSGSPGGKNVQSYIKVHVKRPLNERQTQAYVGDWVVTATDERIKGFKVYTPRAFAESFDEILEHMSEVLERMGQRSIDEETAEDNDMFPEELHFSHTTH